jgi:Nucleotidyltransferase of unknown function (DUF6036)
MKYKLNIQTIHEALSRLNDALLVKETTGEICIFGGAAMILAFDARFATRDVDAIFVPKNVISGAIEMIADEMNLPKSWLNDGVKGFVSDKNDFTEENMPQFSHLRVIRPSAPYLLAMKCMASRVGGYGERGDITDIKLLCKHLQCKDAEEVFRFILAYYPQSQIPIRTRYFIEEIFQEPF